MKIRSYTLIFIFLLLRTYLFSQWTQRTGLGQNNARTFSSSFSVNGKIYLIGGNFNFTGLDEVREYDPVTDTWTMKSPFPGGVRGGATAFSIGSLGYLMCGSNYTGQYFKDVWEYNPANDSWTQKATPPFFKREEAMGFSIGNLGYLGTGYFEIVTPNGTSSATLNDFWQYNPANDTWIQRAAVPGLPRAWAIGASAGGMGYSGMGGDPGQTSSFSDFYRFDPAQNAWTQITSYPQTVAEAAAFSWNDEVYVCGGINFTNMNAFPSFRKYIPATNTWSVMPSFSGGAIVAATAATVANRAFLGTGFDSGLTERTDWWEFVQVTTTCPGPIAFNTATVASAANPCSGKILISGIVNACEPYTLSIVPNSGTVQNGTGTATISGLCAGDYTVTITDNNCCGSTQKVCKVTQNSSVRLDENGIDNSFLSLFPNPNAGYFIVQGRGFETIEKSNITIHDIVGKEVGFEVVQKDYGRLINLSTVIKGVYFLSYTHAKGVVTRKFIVD